VHVTVYPPLPCTLMASQRPGAAAGPHHCSPVPWQQQAFTVSEILPFPECYAVEIIWCVAFAKWPFHLVMCI
jgi:hypothetical protein